MSKVEGFSDKECECGCGNLLPLSLMHKPGRRFLYGHKPQAGGAGLPVGDGARRAPRAAVVRVAGYGSTLGMVEENLLAVRTRKQEIEEEIGVLREQLAQMERSLILVLGEQARLDTLREALTPFCTAEVPA